MANRIHQTFYLISELAQKHVELLKSIDEARSLLAQPPPNTFLGRSSRKRCPDQQAAETPDLSAALTLGVIVARSEDRADIQFGSLSVPL